MGTSWRKVVALVFAGLCGVSLTVEAQSPPNLYQWLAANPGFGGLYPNLGPTSNYQWYWGCAAGLPGACQYVAVGPRSAQTGLIQLYYDYNNLTTPSGSLYALFDAWSWKSPDPNCTGSGTHVLVPATCVSILPQMVWQTRVDTGWSGNNQQSFGISFAAVSRSTATPEPAVLTLLGTGLAGLGGLARLRRRKHGS